MVAHGERRRHIRIPCNFDLLESDEFEPLGQTINIGTGGCYYKMSRPIAPETDVKAIFELPYTLAMIKVPGKVVRVEKGSNRAALEFTSMEEKDKKILNQYIEDFVK